MESQNGSHDRNELQPNHPERENSVDLLSRIMSEQEQANARAARRPSHLPVILLSLCCVALAAGLIIVSVLWQRQSSSDAAIISGLSNQLASASSELRDTKSDLAVSQRTLESRQALLESARADLASISPEYHFYNQYACIIPENDRYYNQYGCKYCDISSFYIYNLENAQGLGYLRCPYCW